MSYYTPFYNTGYYNPMPTPQANNNNTFYHHQTPQNGMLPSNQQMTNDMIWVQGLAGAKAYLVAPNTTVTLWDSESKTVYLKSCDSSGIPSMKILNYTECAENPSSVSSQDESNKSIQSEDISALNGRFDDILSELNVVKSKINELSEKSTVKNSKKSEE